MSQVTLDRVLALNKELAALADAGVPLELGARSKAVDTVLDKANASLALRTSLGQPLTEAIEDNPDLPGIYRHAVESGVLSGNLTSVLDGVSRQSLAGNELRQTVGQSFVQPIILLALAYLGLFVLCLRFSPSLEGIYEQLRQEPSFGVALLRAARHTLPIWGPIVPLSILAAMFLWRRGWGIPTRWLPFSRRYAATIAQTSFADQLANLLDKNVPLPEALELASGVTGNQRLMAAAGALAAAERQGEKLTAEDPRLRRLPPLLRWALTGDLGKQPLPEILRFASQTYRQSAERQSAVWRAALPTLIGAGVGGFIVFIYALCMFGPFINLLHDLATLIRA